MIEEAFTETARKCPGALAVVDGDTRLTYLELESRKNEVARHLSEGLGVGPGDWVGVQLRNCWEYVAVFFALARLGAVCVALNKQWRGEELEWCTRALNLAAVVTDGPHLKAWLELALIPSERILPADIIRTLDFGRGLPPGPAARRFADEPAACFMTSGSTGKPRPATRSYRNLIGSVRNVARAIGHRPGMRSLCVIPFNHSNGLCNSMVLSLTHGGIAVLMPEFAPAAMAELVRRERVEVLNASPFIYTMLLESGWTAEDFSAVEVSLSSGAPMARELALQCAGRLGLKVRQLYGTSETATLSVGPPTDEVESGFLGKPFPFIELKLLSADGKEAPAGVEGEVVVKSPLMMKGYLLEAEGADDVFVKGFFRTGDLGRLDEAGNLTLSGRIKHVINVAGVKVDPVEIERVLAGLSGIQDCLVRAAKDHRQMEVIQAVIVVAPGAGLSREAVVAHCRAHLAEYKIPRLIEFAESIPRDLMSKISSSWRGGGGGPPQT